ncbi:MAG: glycoside hydrolase N-terminal domain-containing protein [Clostridia bacterium]|nr:glycoside hydrolase N-terminal domain-containing protein [Clostridia bacterium]
MNKHILYLDSPASEWELATPVGGGSLGAMIYGDTTCERLQLSEESLWSGEHFEATHADFRDKIDRIRQLLLDGQVVEAESYAKEALKDDFYRIKSHETAGDLLFDFGGTDDCADYRRELDVLSGIATVSFMKNGERQMRETFASYPDRVIAARHTGRHSVRISYGRAACSWKNGLKPTESDWFGVESVAADGDTLTVHGRTVCGAHTFCVKLRAVTDGELSADGDTLVIRDAEQTDYVIAIAVDGEPILPDADYGMLRTRSADDLSALLGRSDIVLDEREDAFADLSVDKRLERLKADETAVDPWLCALYFRFGKYLLVASSREGTLPANLQGVWNGYTEAPWNCDYHTNINLQMNYWHAEVANLTECTPALFDYMNHNLLESGRHTAQVDYRCRGTVLHHLSDIYGFTAPADGLWGLWPLGGAWLCYAMWEHYLYTKDIDFLRDTAYEYIRDSARFFLDFMFEDEQGRLLSGPSTSPENHYYYKGAKVQLCLSPSMDVEIIGGLLKFYIETEELLGLNPDWSEEARQALTKMPGLKVGKHGQLMEWMEDWDEPEPGHRHISHLFALYPDCAISMDTPELFAAAKKTLERRLANGGGHTGWSCAWLIALFARLGDSEGAASTIRKLLTKSTRGNLLDSHPPFQIDGNFGASAALVEMLMQSHNGKIVLLPACPEMFANGHFERLCARGGAEVSAKWRDGAVTEVIVEAVRCDYEGLLEMNGSSFTLTLKKGERIVIFG